MEYFRRFLIALRREENDNNYKFKVSTMALMVSLFGIFAGILLDVLLPFSYFPNMLRGVIAVITGVALFIISYLKATDFSNKKMQKDRYYRKVRERLSFRQRVNFSIAIGILLALFIMLSSNEGVMFTFKSILVIFLTIVLVAFCRRSRSEFIKGIYEIPDIRDLEAEKEQNKKKAERRSKEQKKKSGRRSNKV